MVVEFDGKTYSTTANPDPFAAGWNTPLASNSWRVELDPQRVGNRGSHRYSFGNFESVEHQDAWAALVDPPVLMAVLGEVFETDDFICRDGTGGADFVLPGALDFQHLHSDGSGEQHGKYRDVLLGTRPNGSKFRQGLDVPKAPGCTYEVVN